MSLFVVKHQHGAETCPAGDPQMGPMLLQHLSKPKELTDFVQTGDAFSTLRDRELVRHLIAGLVAFSPFPVWLPDKADGEAAFSVYKTNNPAQKDQPFLLIVRTQHIVTTFRLVAWDTRSFQHMAECSAHHY